MRKRVPLQVIYEDNHLIAVNKPAGILVHGDETGDISMDKIVKNYIKHRYNKAGDVFLGVTHRIDRPVSGVVIFARTSKALSRMNKMFQNNEIKKKYLALVNHRPPDLEGTLTHYMIKDNKRNISKGYDNEKKRAKKAVLNYKLISELSRYTMLEIFPQSGRSHQIRVQLSKVGCSIIGDVKYGYNKVIHDKSICLHCQEMSFMHPTKKELTTISADLPKNDFWDLFTEA